MMKTYIALVSAKAGNSKKLIKTEIKAASAIEAKWLLQAVYGFHAVNSMPTEVHETVTQETTHKPLTPDQQKITNLKAVKDRAADALKDERDKQRMTCPH